MIDKEAAAVLISMHNGHGTALMSLTEQARSECQLPDSMSLMRVSSFYLLPARVVVQREDLLVDFPRVIF